MAMALATAKGCSRYQIRPVCVCRPVQTELTARTKHDARRANSINESTEPQEDLHDRLLLYDAANAWHRLCDGRVAVRRGDGRDGSCERHRHGVAARRWDRQPGGTGAPRDTPRPTQNPACPLYYGRKLPEDP